MYIAGIKLFNIRSYQEASIEFSKKINILVGKNNSGKSTILKAVYCIQKRESLAFLNIRKGSTKGNILITVNVITKTDRGSFIALNAQNSNQYLESIIISSHYNNTKILSGDSLGRSLKLFSTQPANKRRQLTKRKSK